ncbi:GNVR domain-containing protein [Jiella sp. M17.18]|uniref:GNVR domain-containing protein n=1 Tax=Jiella sp. M17.18 TaxID=3234247 RepID=UPI0034DFA392
MATTTGPTDSLVDPLYIIGSVWTQRRMILLATLLGFALAVIYALSTPKLYTADSQILMDPRDIKVVQNEVTPNGLPSDATLALIQSQIQVIYSDDVLGRVVAEAKLADDPEFNGQAKGALAPLLTPLSNLFGPPQESARDAERRRLLTLDHLRRAMKVDRDQKSFVLNVAVTTRDADKSARLANLIADSFIQQLGKVQAQTARTASDALSGRLAELRKSVVNAEQAVEDYKSQHDLVGVGGKLVDDDYITRISDQLGRSKADTTALKVKADQMKKASVDDVIKGTLPEELTSEALSKLRNTYSDLQQQAASLRSTLGPKHPRRIAIEQALASVRSAISAELNRIVSAAQTELARAQETNRELTRELDTLKSKQLQTGEAFVKLRELEREVDASRAVYESFLLRARETGEQETINTANVRVISPATPPLDPSSTSRRVVVLAGVFLGFLAGVGIAVLTALIRLFRGRFDPMDPGAGRGRGLQRPVPASAAGETLQLAGIRPAIHARTSELRRPEEPELDDWADEEPVLDYDRPHPDHMHALPPEDTPPLDDDIPGVHEPVPHTGGLLGPEMEQRSEASVREDATPGRPLAREELRAHLRAIVNRAAPDGRPGPAEPDDAEVARLANDLRSVKEQIAGIRSRKQTLRGGARG